MMAADAMRPSSRHQMKAETKSMNTTRAVMAFSVMLRPHVELTEVVLTSSTVTSAFVANASWMV